MTSIDNEIKRELHICYLLGYSARRAAKLCKVSTPTAGKYYLILRVTKTNELDFSALIRLIGPEVLDGKA